MLYLVFTEGHTSTGGSGLTDVSLADVAKAAGTFDKGVFIKEIEEALDAGEIDIAVHSLKDLPTVLEDRYLLAAVLERAPVRDVLVMREPGGLAGEELLADQAVVDEVEGVLQHPLGRGRLAVDQPAPLQGRGLELGVRHGTVDRTHADAVLG